MGIAATTSGFVFVWQRGAVLEFEVARGDVFDGGGTALSASPPLYDLDARFGMAVAVSGAGVSVLSGSGWTMGTSAPSARTAALYRAASGPARVAAYSPSGVDTVLESLDAPDYQPAIFAQRYANVTISRVRPTASGGSGFVTGSTPDGSVIGLVASNDARLESSAARVEAVASGEDQVAAVAVRSAGATYVYSPQPDLMLSSMAISVHFPADAAVAVSSLAVQGSRVVALVTSRAATAVGVGFGRNPTVSTQVTPERALLVLLQPNEVFSLPDSTAPYGLALRPNDGGLLVMHGRGNDGGTVLLFRQ